MRTEDVTTLIRFIKAHPIIWNPLYVDVPDAEKYELWSSIATTLNCGVQDVISRWYILMNKVKLMIQFPGEDDEEWEFYDQLGFVFDFLHARNDEVLERASLPPFHVPVRTEGIWPTRADQQYKVDILIHFLKNNPIAWMEEDPEAPRKELLWSKICSRLNCEVSDAKARWAQLCSKVHSMMPVPSAEDRLWKHYKSMEFYVNHLRSSVADQAAAKRSARKKPITGGILITLTSDDRARILEMRRERSIARYRSRNRTPSPLYLSDSDSDSSDDDDDDDDDDDESNEPPSEERDDSYYKPPIRIDPNVIDLTD